MDKLEFAKTAHELAKDKTFSTLARDIVDSNNFVFDAALMCIELRQLEKSIAERKSRYIEQRDQFKEIKRIKDALTIASTPTKHLVADLVNNLNKRDNGVFIYDGLVSLLGVFVTENEERKNHLLPTKKSENDELKRHYLQAFYNLAQAYPISTTGTSSRGHTGDLLVSLLNEYGGAKTSFKASTIKAYVRELQSSGRTTL